MIGRLLMRYRYNCNAQAVVQGSSSCSGKGLFRLLNCFSVARGILCSTVGHTLPCIVGWSEAKSQTHAYDMHMHMYDTTVSRIEFVYIPD
jgi:hypothetical protein